MNKLYSLQNGTDIRGVAYYDENIGLEKTLLDQDVSDIVLGFATWILNKTNDKKIKIALGMDSRITGEHFKKVAMDTLSKAGVDVYDCSLATTPAMFMSTVMPGYECDGAIMFTASHMPYIYNGLKIFTEKGVLEKNELKEVLDIAVSKKFINESEFRGNITSRSLIEDYSKSLVKTIRSQINSDVNFDKPLKNMKIIVDAGNGAGGFFAEKVLAELGADTDGSQFLDPDGMFPNHIPNPENKEAMKSISEATVKNKADLGIIFDTDVDRAAVVGNSGREINKNALIALMSKIVLEETPGATIVTDSVTSNGLTDFINKNGGKHHRFKRGYKNVINESIRLNEEGIFSPLAIETSGHAAMKENYFLDDGAYIISKILVKAAVLNNQGKKIEDIIEGLDEAAESKEKRFKINREDFKSYGQEILNDFKLFVSEQVDWKEVQKNYEGVRVDCLDNFEQGWLLIRMSLHEPILVLNVESDKNGGCEKIYSKIEDFIKKYDITI
ncbi:phosphohexomutase domain-containing protein [Peptostreptococcus faecalis]|uniref:phosphomannomutase/phosphoglucomutase n=1 Tax=Peptostreptococcus faecalis TaxID=2045015 RepID=UPI000C7C51FB|nr:phosphomannomutase/phosphoglucomutase [Peptostreptococcus faecalis]